MVRDFRLRLGHCLLLCLPAAASASAEQPAQIRTTLKGSAATREKLQKLGQDSDQIRGEQSVVRHSMPQAFDRRRAMKSLREISAHVAKMKQRSQKEAAQQEFNRKRAEQTLREVTSFVADMKQRTRATQRTVAGPIEDVHVHHYDRRHVPIPQRIEKTSGLTHSEFAEMRLIEKGYVKTVKGWLPPPQRRATAQEQLNRKERRSFARSLRHDPF